MKAVAESLNAEHYVDYFVLTKPLDFFDNVAYLIRERYIPLRDMKSAFGAAMVEYYELFEDYVLNYMRKEDGNEEVYLQLEQVVRKLQNM